MTSPPLELLGKRALSAPKYIRVASLIYRLAGSQIATLRDYLTQGEDDMGMELAEYNPRLFLEWFRDEFSDVLDYLYNTSFDSDDEAISMLYLMAKKDPKEFVNFLYKHADADVLEAYGSEETMEDLHLGDPNAPSFVFLTYEGDYNGWMIHFSEEKNILKIAQEGFTKGFSDHTRLGLTTWAKADELSPVEKALSGIIKMKNPPKPGPGYNFAYTLNDYSSYMKHENGTWRYGRAAVIFQGSALLASHISDDDVQAIFWGPEAKSIIAIVPADKDTYFVLNCNGDPINDPLPFVEAVKLATKSPQASCR